MDDAYCAGRLVELLDGEPTDAAEAAVRLRRSFPSGEEGLRASQSARNLLAAGLESDIAWCARESVLDVVPVVTGLAGTGTAVELSR
jgi:phosphosulfolactate phosphohydrolase-like enzyme